MVSIIILATIGACIALYSYLVERKIQQNPEYKPVCDLSDRISCSKPIKSPYKNIFFISNSLLALFFYVLLIGAAILHFNTFIIFTTIIGCIISCIFAYLLYFKIKSLCLLCTALYIINFLLLYISIRSL